MDRKGLVTSPTLDCERTCGHVGMLPLSDEEQGTQKFSFEKSATKGCGELVTWAFLVHH